MNVHRVQARAYKVEQRSPVQLSQIAERSDQPAKPMASADCKYQYLAAKHASFVEHAEATSGQD